MISSRFSPSSAKCAMLKRRRMRRQSSTPAVFLLLFDDNWRIFFKIVIQSSYDNIWTICDYKSLENFSAISNFTSFECKNAAVDTLNFDRSLLCVEWHEFWLIRLSLDYVYPTDEERKAKSFDIVERWWRGCSDFVQLVASCVHFSLLFIGQLCVHFGPQIC